MQKSLLKKIVFLSSVFLIMLTYRVYPQFAFNFSSSFFYDDNIFRNSIKQGSLISNSTIGTAYNYAKEKLDLKLIYNADLAFFNEIPSRNYNQHNFIIDYVQVLENERSAFNLGGGYLFRSDRDIYNLYDENNFSIYCNFKFDLDENIEATTGYNFNISNYPNLSELNYSEHILNLFTNFTFKTKTTYFGELSWGFKNYSNDLVITTSSLGSSGHPFGWMNHGEGPGMPWKNNTISTSLKSDKLNSQILFSNKIAQSIIDNIGIQFTYALRYNLIKNNRDIIAGSNYVSDDEIFDDHYGYSGHEFEFGYTHLLPLGITLKANFDYFIKSYNNKFIATLSETSEQIQRDDKKSIFSLSIKKKLDLLKNLFDPFNVFLNFIYQNNNSSVTYYNFNTNSVFLGISSHIVL